MPARPGITEDLGDTRTISRGDALCWSPVRLSILANVSPGCSGFVMGVDDIGLI
jgi:hypothetical protein